jgi:Family of unknown function (DUF6629)
MYYKLSGQIRLVSDIYVDGTELFDIALLPLYTRWACVGGKLGFGFLEINFLFMCFSAPVSFVASGALAVTGIATMRKVKSRKYIPLAIMPLLFSLQQFIEGMIWVTAFDSTINHLLVYGFLFLAYLLWPIFTPVAIFLVEKRPQRAKIMKFFIIMGAFVSMSLLTALILRPPEIAIVDCHIGHPYVLEMLYGAHFPFYLAVVGLCPLLSTHRILRLFGLTILLTGLITAFINRVTFISLWCFFAAVLSLLLYLFLDEVGKKKTKVA